MRWSLAPIIALFFALPSLAGAQNAAALDLNHTATNFAAKHLLISTVQGNIPIKSTSIVMGADYVPASIDAVMDLTKIDTHNDRRDNDLRSERFLDAAQFPEMTFKSTKITRAGPEKFVMDGDLTIHGITKPVVVNGTIGGSVKDKQGRTHVGYAATALIDRRQWNVGATIPAAVVSNEINITIEAEAIL
jgi:polyisoprenoid-binding protein YceI